LKIDSYLHLWIVKSFHSARKRFMGSRLPCWSSLMSAACSRWRTCWGVNRPAECQILPIRRAAVIA